MFAGASKRRAATWWYLRFSASDLHTNLVLPFGFFRDVLEGRSALRLRECRYLEGIGFNNCQLDSSRATDTGSACEAPPRHTWRRHGPNRPVVFIRSTPEAGGLGCRWRH